MNVARREKDRIRTRVEEGNPPARVHGDRAPKDLFYPGANTLTREQYHAALAAEKARREA